MVSMESNLRIKPFLPVHYHVFLSATTITKCWHSRTSPRTKSKKDNNKSCITEAVSASFNRDITSKYLPRSSHQRIARLRIRNKCYKEDHNERRDNTKLD